MAKILHAFLFLLKEKYFFWVQTKASAPSQFKSSQFYLGIAKKDLAWIKKRLNGSLEGLSALQIIKRRKKFGLNKLVATSTDHWLIHLFKTCMNPIVLLLTVMSLISFLTDDKVGSFIIFIMVLLSVILTFVQERKSNHAAEKLRSMVRTFVTVMRQGSQKGSSPEKKEIPLEELVRGDIILLSAGDIVPADVRLLTSRDLFVNQAPLTGESLPVEKDSAPSLEKEVLELRNICFAGTTIISGTASGLVLKAGRYSYFGALAKNVMQTRTFTDFELGIQRFTWLMIRLMAVMVFIVFLVNGFLKGVNS
jgi:Mg2+-importing ATPase